MLKLLSEENLKYWSSEGASCQIAPILEEINRWTEGLDNSWYDDIIYQTLDRVVDIILDNLEE